MARAEVDSFILKFKNLLLSGKTATLVIKSNNGEAAISLNVEVGKVTPPPACDGHPANRVGPSRLRRRQRRAAEREASKAENAVDASEDQAKAVEATHLEKNKRSEQETLKDEFCSDETFEDKEDIENKGNMICVTLDDVFEQKKEVTEKVMREKLISAGIEMLKIEGFQTEQGKLKVKVRVKPISKEKVDAASYPLSVVGWNIQWN